MKQVFITIFLIVVLAGCRQAEYRGASGAVWGTTYHITYKADRDLADSAVAEMRRVELSLSMFDGQSAVSRYNNGETDMADSMMIEVYRLCVEVNRLSHGAFDPTVGPLVDLWGFGKNKLKDGEVPDSADVLKALGRVGINRTMLHGNYIRASVPGIRFDFSAVAKGYGVDCVARRLQACGASDYLVEIGGEIVARGVNPAGKPWRVQIDAPVSANPGDSALRVLELTDCAVATSGNYRNFRTDAAGRRYGHTISPLTGYPVQTDVLSATVIAPDCALADALATACMAMGYDAAAAMMRQIDGVRAILVVSHGDTYTVEEVR